MKKSQQGFALLESILILVIIAIISGTGWYVWHSKAQTEKTLDNASAENIPAGTKKTSTKKPALPDETANWFIYKSPRNIYTIKLPDGWRLVKQTEDSLSLVGFSIDDITVKPGTKASVEVQFGGRDGPIPFELMVVGEGGFNQADTHGDKQTSLRTSQGISVDKYVYTQNSAPEGPGLPKGGKGYKYIVTKGATTIEIFHDESPGDPSNVETVEKVVKTLEL